MPKLLDKQAVEEIEARANAATEGPWESDNAEDSEHRYQYYMAIDPASRVLFDTFNSALGEIHEEVDEDGVYRWDEVARRNIAFASHAREDVPALCRTVKHLWAERDAVRSDLEDRTTEREMCRGRYDEELKEHNETQSQLEQLRAENERLTKQLADIEEREAALCPEDVGFAEYIRTLETKLERLSK